MGEEKKSAYNDGGSKVVDHAGLDADLLDTKVIGDLLTYYLNLSRWLLAGEWERRESQWTGNIDSFEISPRLEWVSRDRVNGTEG